MQKKGAISNTIVWFFVTIFVCFLMAIYLFFVSSIALSKGDLFSSSYTLNVKGIEDNLVKRTFVNFLNSKIDFNGERMKVYELIADKDLDGNEIYFQEFKHQSSLFLYNLYKEKKIVLWGDEIKSSSYGSALIRIYPSKTLVEFPIKGGFSSGKYDSSYGGSSADGLVALDICSSSRDNMLFEVFVSDDKKVILCMEYSNE